MSDDPEQWRVQFDAEVTFANGGALQAQEFRLDASGPDISDTELGELFVRHLGLLMVGKVKIRNKQMLREAHKGSRGTAGAEHRPGARIVDLSQAGPRLADAEGVLVRVLGSAERPIERGLFLPYDITGKAVLIHTGWDRIGSVGRHYHGHPFLTADAAEWLAERQPALVGIDAPSIDDTDTDTDADADTDADTGADNDTDTRPARTALLKAGIPVLENLRGLDRLPPHGFRLHAAPLAAEGAGTLPVRAYALIGEKR
ncbi:cyclase family protein [Streptomyces narbonensis]|uniref:Cyclase family protein n=1 Tax=Streptomyces narbonensis TaxID=67333 RepID=A0ABV3C5Q0_9ACTN